MARQTPGGIAALQVIAVCRDVRFQGLLERPDPAHGLRWVSRRQGGRGSRDQSAKESEEAKWLKIGWVVAVNPLPEYDPAWEEAKAKGYENDDEMVIQDLGD